MASPILKMLAQTLPYWADVGIDANGCLNPTAAPTNMPTREPTPTAAPTAEPTASPTNKSPKYEAEAVTNNMPDGVKTNESNWIHRSWIC